ncbi:hypothetical protein C1H76_1282 [Elsinoe australis]|uniref:T6SS Phospholipase effector Tle1-like catalytic domain-containing protein n=1 Tax=Elsinoe australis TaxID=40998 RepID=A0A4U7B9N2_9PEZI|nr:hypothetical protein C1H76_1282 [Elsinoe australis]
MLRAPSVANGSRIAPSRIAQPEDFKRLIICADGTWLNADESVRRSRGKDNPSNATRISRAILPQSSDGIKQIVYYSQGVGTHGGIVDRIYGGITGDGLAGNVREAYGFICSNYEPGDELFLFGFSRGAFTVRAIAGLIDEIGVLTKAGSQFLPEIYKDVQNRRNPDYKPVQPNKPFRNKPSAGDPRYKAELRRRGYTVLGVPIKVVGVWDTVGSLGTPSIGWLDKVGLQGSASKQMSFYDTKLVNCIENAFQALALDEKRAAFSPSLWEKMPDNKTRLRQVWFPGVHSNIGGGYDDQELSNITLAWMMSQVREMIDLDLDYVLDEQEKTEEYYEKNDEKPRPWSFGKIWNSFSGIYMLGGQRQRSPGRYYVLEPRTGVETDEPLMDTHEYIHPSVRSRIKLGGPGVDDRGTYGPGSMKDWKLMIEPGDDGGRPDIFWELKTKQSNVTTRILPESPLWPLEKELLEMEPDREIEDYVLRPPLSARAPRSSRRASRLRK